MRNRITRLTIVGMIVSITFGSATTAYAKHHSPIYRATAEYREVVRDFERAVIRSKHLDRRHRKVADDLEDATSPLRSAARHPDRAERLFDAWDEVQYRQGRAAAIIFADPTCPSAAELSECWFRVLDAFDRVAAQMVACGWHPVYEHGPIYIEPQGYDVVPTPEILPAPAPLPPAGLHHPSQWKPNRTQEFEPHWIQNLTPAGGSVPSVAFSLR